MENKDIYDNFKNQNLGESFGHKNGDNVKVPNDKNTFNLRYEENSIKKSNIIKNTININNNKNRFNIESPKNKSNNRGSNKADFYRIIEENKHSFSPKKITKIEEGYFSNPENNPFLKRVSEKKLKTINSFNHSHEL